MNWKHACRWAVASSALATVAASVFALPASAAPAPDSTGTTVAPAMLAAMQRDLGLTADQAIARLDRDKRGSAVERSLAPKLGASYAGSWLAPGADKLTMATTDASRVGQIRAAGAEAKVVGQSYQQLNAAKLKLDGLGYSLPGVSGWHVDVTTNSVTVLTKTGATDAARSFVQSAGVNPASVRFVEANLAPRPLYDVRGGDEYRIDGRSLCSVGFPVQGGFVTAGHCGRVGSRTAGGNGVDQGTFEISSFPGNDYAFVKTNSQWTPKGVVNHYDGTTVTVAGSQESAVGAAVCRSGRTTGWKCGTILGKNESVTYPEGTITGMTRTNACAEPGDSGGSWLSGQQAQGVTSGGSGDCSQGGTIWFYPLNVILSRTGKTLITDGGGGEPPVGCEGIAAWSATTGYAPGDVVGHASHKWEATFWSTGAQPGDPGSWAVWKDAGAC